MSTRGSTEDFHDDPAHGRALQVDTKRLDMPFDIVPRADDGQGLHQYFFGNMLHSPNVLHALHKKSDRSALLWSQMTALWSCSRLYKMACPALEVQRVVLKVV